MNQCTSCGFQNADTSKFCKMCGTKLENNVAQRTCLFCGKKAPQGTLFCMACGNPLEESTKKPEIQTEPTYANIQSEEVTFSGTEQAPKKKTGIIILLIVFLIAIILVVVGVVFAQKNANSDKNQNEDTKNEQQLDDDADDDEADDGGNDREDIADKSQIETKEDSEEEQISEELIQEEQFEDNIVIQDANYILPESNIRMLTISDLYLLTAEECRLARNEIYARHGRIFRDQALQNYFESKDWYRGTIHPDDFDEEILTQIEVANRDLIVQYEEMRGYN